MKELLFITHSTSGYSTIYSISMALKGGCRSIQLRMKEATPEKILATGRIVKQMCDEYNAKLYIDDHPHICKELEATGVHLGKSDMKPSDARRLLGDSFIIGGTANTWEDILYLDSEGVDYIGLGPFRFTTTKKNLSPVLGLEGYSTIMKLCRDNHIHLPVVAIGGITKKDIPALMQTGIHGIALSSSILQAADPTQETSDLINLIKPYNV